MHAHTVELRSLSREVNDLDGDTDKVVKLFEKAEGMTDEEREEVHCFCACMMCVCKEVHCFCACMMCVCKEVHCLCVCMMCVCKEVHCLCVCMMCVCMAF